MSQAQSKELKEKIAEVKALHQEGKSEEFHQTVGGRYIKDLVYGANDGIITTFAIVSGIAGADLSVRTVLILGFANLIADGISMGASNFLGSRSETQFAKKLRAEEAWEIEHLPEEEIREVRRIFEDKGFKGKDLERAVQIITSDKDRWIDVMMKEELGLVEEEGSQAGKSGLVTFFAFVIAGFMPLFSYVFLAGFGDPFVLSIVITAITLFVIGALRTCITKQGWIKAGLEMLFVGMAAAAAAYGIGFALKGLA